MLEGEMQFLLLSILIKHPLCAPHVAHAFLDLVVKLHGMP
jgi:hypothetical protein